MVWCINCLFWVENRDVDKIIFYGFLKMVILVEIVDKIKVSLRKSLFEGVGWWCLLV